MTKPTQDQQAFYVASQRGWARFAWDFGPWRVYLGAYFTWLPILYFFRGFLGERRFSFKWLGVGVTTK